MKSRYLFLMFFTVQTMPGRFASLFLQAHGLTPSQIGLMFSVGNIIAIGSTPFFSVISDATTSRARVVLYLYIASVFCLLLHSFALPSIGIIQSSWHFSYLLLARCAFCFVNRPVLTIVTAISVAQLRDIYGDEGPSKYGTERLWGTIGWGLGSLIVGALLDISNMNVMTIYCGNVFMSIVFIIFVEQFHRSNIKKTTSSQKQQEKNEDIEKIHTKQSSRTKNYQTISTTQTTSSSFSSSSSSCTTPPSQQQKHIELPNDVNKNNNINNNNNNNSGIYLLVHTMRTVIFSRGASSISFFLLIACLSSGMSAVTMLQFLYFYNELHASGTLCGIAVLITVIFEVPLFAYAPQLLKNFGPVPMVIVAAISFGIRALAYATIPTSYKWIVLLFEPLHGVTFASVQTAGVAYVARFTPPGADATAQATFTLVRTIAGVAGVGIGGLIMQVWSGRVLYAGYGIIVLVATMLFEISRKYLKFNSDYQLDTKTDLDEHRPLIVKS